MKSQCVSVKRKSKNKVLRLSGEIGAFQVQIKKYTQAVCHMASSREKCNLQEQHCFLFIFTLLKGHFSSAVPSMVGGSCDMGSEVTPKTNPSHPSFSPQDTGSIRSWQLTPAGLKQFTSISGIKIIKKCSILAGKSA